MNKKDSLDFFRFHAYSSIFDGACDTDFIVSVKKGDTGVVAFARTYLVTSIRRFISIINVVTSSCGLGRNLEYEPAY